MRNTEHFEVDAYGEQFILEVHTENPAHEARIRWEVSNQNLSGEWGRLYLPESMPGGADQVIEKPILAFAGREPITTDGQERGSIELPQSLALQLRESLDKCGTATIHEKRICDDASRFPSSIQYRTQVSTEHLDKVRWDSNRNLMWYSPDRPQARNVSPRLVELVSRLDLYGYQIENGKLIHRTREFPSEEAASELKQFLQRAGPDSDSQSEMQSFRIDEPLE
jgi:hypothetical protein